MKKKVLKDIFSESYKMVQKATFYTGAKSKSDAVPVLYNPHIFLQYEGPMFPALISFLIFAQVS